MSAAQHDTFVIDRVFDAPPSLVFHAWSDMEAKRHWFRGGPDWIEVVRKQDFRVGGRDELTGRRDNGWSSTFHAQYLDIVPDTRIVYVYEMTVNGKKISISLATVEFTAEGKRTRLIVTEQGAFIDGYIDGGSRKHGVGVQMDMLAAALAR